MKLNNITAREQFMFTGYFYTILIFINICVHKTETCSTWNIVNFRVEIFIFYPENLKTGQKNEKTGSKIHFAQLLKAEHMFVFLGSYDPVPLYLDAPYIHSL